MAELYAGRIHGQSVHHQIQPFVNDVVSNCACHAVHEHYRPANSGGITQDNGKTSQRRSVHQCAASIIHGMGRIRWGDKISHLRRQTPQRNIIPETQHESQRNSTTKGRQFGRELRTSTADGLYVGRSFAWKMVFVSRDADIVGVGCGDEQ